MSKGPGKQQRRILDELEARPIFYLAELLPKDYTRAEYIALHRAAHKLTQKRLIKMAGQYSYRWMGLYAQRYKILVSRPDFQIDPRTAPRWNQARRYARVISVE